jgi:hypothetical protein
VEAGLLRVSEWVEVSFCLLHLNPNSSESPLHMCEVALRGADFFEFPGGDVGDDFGFLTKGF